jgi:hypothetical protein
MPRTTFAKGLKEGKVMACEMSGIILVLSATLRCTKGRELILNKARGTQKFYFPDERAISMWIMLLETQLQFGAWLKLPEVSVENVERSKVKLREYQNMNKRVGRRNEGMGNNTMNFHGTKHAPEDWLNFAVSDNINTKSDEAGHKPDKKNALRTNKQVETWDISTATKIANQTAVEYGIEETKGRMKWHYYRGHDHSDRNDKIKNKDPFAPLLTGAKIKLWIEEGDDEWKIKVFSEMIGKEKYVYDASTRKGIVMMADFVLKYKTTVFLHAVLKVHDTRADNNSQIFRASPYFQGMPWYDWAIFDLSEDTPDDQNEAFVPAQIEAFMDLTDLPEENDLDMVPGIYAIAERARMSTDYDELGRAEMWEPWKKDPTTSTDLPPGASKMSFLNINKIVSPAVLIPDVGNKNKRAYLRLVSKSAWAKLFDEWLASPHQRTFDDPAPGAPPEHPPPKPAKIPKRRRKKHKQA